MCFHNALTVDARRLKNRYRADFAPGTTFQPVYHAAAFAHPAWPVITNTTPATFRLFRWGLVPSWIKGPAEANDIRRLTCNARAETVLVKPSFAQPARRQRCLVPSTGFFEWQAVGKRKIPWFIHGVDTPVFSMAGLWDAWTDPATGSVLHTFTIITTAANAFMAVIHNTKFRMPLILTPETESLWISDTADPRAVAIVLQSVPAIPLQAHTVGPLIGMKNRDTNIPDVQQEQVYPVNMDLRFP